MACEFLICIMTLLLKRQFRAKNRCHAKSRSRSGWSWFNLIPVAFLCLSYRNVDWGWKLYGHKRRIRHPWLTRWSIQWFFFSFFSYPSVSFFSKSLAALRSNWAIRFKSIQVMPSSPEYWMSWICQFEINNDIGCFWHVPFTVMFLGLMQPVLFHYTVFIGLLK